MKVTAQGHRAQRDTTAHMSRPGLCCARQAVAARAVLKRTIPAQPQRHRTAPGSWTAWRPTPPTPLCPPTFSYGYGRGFVAFRRGSSGFTLSTRSLWAFSSRIRSSLSTRIVRGGLALLAWRRPAISLLSFYGAPNGIPNSPGDTLSSPTVTPHKFSPP